MPIRLHMVYDSFHAITAELSCNKDHMAHSLKYLLSGCLRKYFANPGSELITLPVHWVP